VKPGEHGCWNEIGVEGDMTCPELRTHVHCRSCPVIHTAGRALFDREPPAGYLREWAATLAHEAARHAKETKSVVVFRVGREWLGLETSLFVEVTENKPVRRVPGKASGVLNGLVNIRGQVELCASMRALLSVAAREAGDNGAGRLLVLEKDRERWVVEVDEVLGMHRYGEEDASPAPATLETSAGAFTRAVLMVGPRSVALLDGAAVWDALNGSLK
jgi:chemotaxis-related protein WspD